MDINPKWVVYATMAVPVLWAFADGGAEECTGGWSPLILVAIVIAGGLYFHDNFVHKSEMKEKGPRDLGGQEPFTNNRYQEQQGGPPIIKYPYQPRGPGR